MKRTQLIMISGKIEAGKSTLAGYINDEFCERGYISEVFHLAESLKIIARKVFGWDGVKDYKGRKLLQDLGKTVRSYNPDYWVENTQLMLENDKDYPFDVIIIDDWRYPNEMDFLKKNPLYRIYPIRIERCIQVLDSHESEVSLPSALTAPEGFYYATIRNESSLESLKDFAAKLCYELVQKENKNV
jgi:hypothetical protein